MGNLNKDISKLRYEIVALRNERQNLLANLALQTENRRTAVALMCAGLAESRTEAARWMQAERDNFLWDLRRAGAARKNGMQLDLAGARRSWSLGRSSAVASEKPGKLGASKAGELEQVQPTVRWDPTKLASPDREPNKPKQAAGTDGKTTDRKTPKRKRTDGKTTDRDTTKEAEIDSTSRAMPKRGGKHSRI